MALSRWFNSLSAGTLIVCFITTVYSHILIGNTATTTTTAPRTNEDQILCPPSFSLLRVTMPDTGVTTRSKYCYHFGELTTFRRASHTCKQKRALVNKPARLAEFEDMREYEIVKTYLEQNKPGNNRFWIGGHASEEDHTKFIWPSSRTPISNTTWVPTEPTYTYQGKKEKCVSFDGRGRHLDDGGVYYGGWRDCENGDVFTGYGLNDEFCVGQRLKYICQCVKLMFR